MSEINYLESFSLLFSIIYLTIFQFHTHTIIISSLFLFFYQAFFKHYLLGHPLPFDRHDWTIQRADGTEVRYVIDYYHDDAMAKEDDGSGLPHMHDHESVKSLLVDVRPAADGLGEIWGRMVTMPLARRVLGESRFQPLPMFPSNSLKSSVEESQQVWANIQKVCLFLN